MVRQQVKKEKHSSANIYHILDFQKKNPWYQEPMIITLGSPINESMIVVKNIVWKGKQILVLMKPADTQTIVLVEAKLKDGRLHYISKLSEEYIRDVSRMLESSN